METFFVNQIALSKVLASKMRDFAGFLCLVDY